MQQDPTPSRVRRTQPARTVRKAYVPLPVTKPPLMMPLLIVAAVLICGMLLQFVLLPNGFMFAEKSAAVQAVSEIDSVKGVRINEVMTGNRSAYSDDKGSASDWVELYNASSAPVAVTGWVLTDKQDRTVTFKFPEYVMQSGEYLLVFTSGDFENDLTKTWHAPFKLSSQGDTLMLFDESGTIVQSMNIPALEADHSYARKEDGTWEETREFTPLLENTRYNYALLTTTNILQGSDIELSEVCASNTMFPAPDGGLYDWIELHNKGTEAVSLSGYGLSDNADKPARWRFPDVTIGAGEYLVVYASGYDGELGGALHTSFRLSSEGESVYLYNPSRQVIGAVTYDNLRTDCSIKLTDSGYASSQAPTPGKPD